MGPFELADLIGLDTSLAILEVLHRELGDENTALPAAAAVRRRGLAGAQDRPRLPQLRRAAATPSGPIAMTDGSDAIGFSSRATARSRRSP